MSSVPLQFLVGATRLIAVYFALRCFDTVANAMMTYAIFYSSQSEIAGSLPTWSIFAISVAFYLAMAIGVWVAAPRICALATNAGAPPPEKPEAEVAWNEVMIFLTGVLIVGWGMAWLAESLVPFFQSLQQGKREDLPVRDSVKFFVNSVLIGFGIVLMAKFHRIYAWMKKRKSA